MSKPIDAYYGEPKLISKRELKNGTKYEHWNSNIDNYHHVHFPDGTLIIFQHENSEGSVSIEEQ